MGILEQNYKQIPSIVSISFKIDSHMRSTNTLVIDIEQFFFGETAPNFSEPKWCVKLSRLAPLFLSPVLLTFPRAFSGQEF